MEPLKILHVIRPAEGGMKEHLLALVKGLMQRNHIVETACPPGTSMAEELVNGGIRVHPVDLVGPLDLKSDLLCITQLKEIMIKGRFDIIHCHGSKAGLVGRIAAILAGFDRVVVTVHNFIVYPEVPLAKKILYSNGEKLLSRRTARIITVSRALKDDLINNYGIPGDKIIPVYNGIDLSLYQQHIDAKTARAAMGLKPDSLVVGTAARMAPQKGLQYFIEAIPEILEKREVFFIVAGDGPLKEELEKQAKDLGLSEKIFFPGFISDIHSLFASLDIFVIPSISEGLSITTIEAMAAGLPVIASKVGGLPELVDDGQTGLLVPPRDHSALAQAVLKLLENPQQASALGQNGRMRAQSCFALETMLEETCNVYLDVVSQ